jgi:Domain of unknown function (DUF6249)
MHPPMHPRDRRFGPLGTLSRALLFAAATVIGCGLPTAAAAAAGDKGKAVVETPSKAAADASVTITPPAAGITTTGPTVTDTGSAAADKTDAKTDSDSTPSKKSPRRRGHIQIGDDDFNSFNDALHTAPWVVGLAFLVAGSILLTPVFLLIGIIWYKLRKTRLQNEAVLMLAERGVMPPAQAVDAVMSGVTPEAAAAAASGPSAAPVYQQTVIARRRAVWSDLRKGVILTAIGLAFVFYWLVNSASASWVGLVLMFLGIAYLILWWLEDRHLQRREPGVGVDVGKS